MLPAASYRRPAFEPINLADADFGIEPATTSAKSDIIQNGFVESIEPEEIAPLLDIDFTSNENTVNSILDTIDEYQYKPFSSNEPSGSYDVQETLKDFRPDLLESYDSAKESDKNHSFDNVQRLPDVATCPVLVTSPDSSKDDCTISSELQSLNTSEICDIDSTNADYSDAELYKCLQECEEREDLLSVNYNGSSLADDVITPQSEFSDELIAEKPLICDDSISETKNSLSSEVSDELLLNSDHDKPQENININEPLVLTEEEKVILEEILEDSSNIDVSYEENKTDQQLLKKELENVLKVTVEDVIQKDMCELDDIPDLPIVSDSSLELKSQCNKPIQVINQQLEELQISNCNIVVTEENNECIPEPHVEYFDPTEKEPTDSLCSVESTETILLKDDNQISINTISDSLDSQSTCSLPSEVIGDTIEHLGENHLQRPNTLDLNGMRGCETELPSTLSTGMFNRLIIKFYLIKFLI